MHTAAILRAHPRAGRMMPHELREGPYVSVPGLHLEHIPGRVTLTFQGLYRLASLWGYLRAWEQDKQKATGIWEAARGYPTSPHSLPGPSGFLSIADEGTHPIGLCRKQPHAGAPCRGPFCTADLSR